MSTNPAFRTTNGRYGEPWLSSAKGALSVKEDVPTYTQLVPFPLSNPHC